ncbi:hypothetical protein [Streptomyces sp. AK02-01A]|uniref:hypothetical protein n=1 Tax=Streptomyces sp. AK02-01A TaxID=3028648 RepID=UPI0029ADE0F7|nr:hypothetical protein [Streptomyces sp. AK02-01A]MDX3855686.1 hypothetical protein [Streptomyces sp. AK02-01A]
MVHDVSRPQAAKFLGLPPARAFNSGTQITSWLRTSGKESEYLQAITRIADRLITEPLIDYHQRRESLRGWSLHDTDWDAIVADITSGHPRTAWTNEDRLAATIYVWARATSSEPCLQPALQQTSSPHPALRHLGRMTHRPARKHRELTAALDRYLPNVIAQTEHTNALNCSVPA